MDNIDFDTIVETIRDEKCVLFLGPEILNINGNSFIETFVNQLNDDLKTKFSFHENDEFFHFKTPQIKNTLYYKLKSFYASNQFSDFYDKLVHIPFNLIISINPDLYLRDAFENQGINHKFSYFHKLKQIGDVEIPSHNNPLIYNLLGTIEEFDSVIFTNDDFFQFLAAILGEIKIPLELQNTLKNSHRYIFLGFKFDKWYVQLIFRLLNIYKAKEKVNEAYNSNISEAIKTFYNEEFRIDFIDTDSYDFIDKLFNYCKQQKFLNSGSNTENKVSSNNEKIRIAVEKSEFETAINLLKAFFEKNNPEIIDDISILQLRYNQITKKLITRRVDNKEAEIEINNIADSILHLNKEVIN